MTNRTLVPRESLGAQNLPLIVFAPGTDAVAGGASSLLASTTNNTVALISGSARGVDMNGTGVTGGVSSGGITVGVYLPIPMSLHLSCSASVGLVYKITGADQFGVVGDEIVTQTQATMNTRRAYSWVSSIQLIGLGTSAGTETLSVGWKYANTAANFAAVPLPFRLKRSADIVGAICLDPADSSLANWAKNTVVAGLVVDQPNSCIRIPSGVVTTQPTVPAIFGVILARGARDTY